MKIVQGVVCPCLGAIYMYITIIITHIFSEIAWPIKAKFYREPPWEVGKKAYINGTGHMTKLAAMLIYGKNFQKFSPTYLIVV